MSERRLLKLMVELFGSLPRQAPGDAASTAAALAAVPELSAEARILDVGCGTGAQTFELARRTEAHIVAVDVLPELVARVGARASELGLDRRVETRVADMAELPFEPGEFDLIWSEGAIYNLGFDTGLETWRTLIRPGGFLAVTEVCWLVAEPPEACRAFWKREYPAIRDVPANLAAIAAAGYRIRSHFALPASTWWKEFYAPLSARLPGFRQAHRDDPEALALADQTRQEIDLHRDHADAYGYVFFVMQKLEPARG